MAISARSKEIFEFICIQMLYKILAFLQLFAFHLSCFYNSLPLRPPMVPHIRRNRRSDICILRGSATRFSDESNLGFYVSMSAFWNDTVTRISPYVWPLITTHGASSCPIVPSIRLVCPLQRWLSVTAWHRCHGDLIDR